MSSRSKGESSTLFDSEMASASLMGCGMLCQAFGAVYKNFLFVCCNFSFCTCRFFIFLALLLDKEFRKLSRMTYFSYSE